MTMRRRASDQLPTRLSRGRIHAAMLAAALVVAVSLGFGAAKITTRAENNCNAIIDLRADIISVLRDAQDPDDSSEFFERAIKRISAPDCP